MDLLEALNWRYATRFFDNTKKVSQEEINFLKESIRLAPTSYGLQAFKVLVTDDQEIKSKLYEASYNQEQVLNCSHIFIFCQNTQVTESLINDYISLRATTLGVEVGSLDKFSKFLKSSLLKESHESQRSWNCKQTYIAMSHLLIACAVKKIDACPMEGFDSNKYDDILNLKGTNYNTTLAVPIGYRDQADMSPRNKKVRKSNTDIFVEL